MTDLNWRGPGRALDAHLNLWRRVNNIRQYLADHNGKYVDPLSMPVALRQRLKLMTATTMPGVQLTIDGASVAMTKDNPAIGLTQFNVLRTAAVVRAEFEALDHGETHFVSRRISEMITAVGESADDEPLFATDLPADAGLVVLEHPLIMDDLDPKTGEILRGLEMPVRAIGWHRAPVGVRREDDSDLLEQVDGIQYTLYADADSFVEHYIRSGRVMIKDDKAGWDDLAKTAYELQLWPIDVSGWSFGKSWRRGGVAARAEFPQGEVHDNVALIRRWLLSLFRFEWQRIIAPEPYQPTKHEAKRAVRAGKTLTDGYIKVLRLRREIGREVSDGTDASHFDHQWIVRGHWRRQWYPLLGPARREDGTFNQDSHRLIWIEPHLSGNPTAPLVAGHNVIAVVR